MKKFFTPILVACCLLISCNNNGQSINSTDSYDSSEEKQKKVTKRDLSVTPQNAYNDIFLDSNSVEKFIEENNLAKGLSRRIRSFYNARNFQFAWFSSKGLTEQARGFWNIHNYQTSSGDTSLINISLQKKMERLFDESMLVVRATDKSMVNTELLLTAHFIRYTLSNYEKGYVKRKEMEKFIPIKKTDPIYLADSLLNKKHKDEKYFEDVNNAYKLLKLELEKYVGIAKKGGWPLLPADAKQFKKGVSSPAVLTLKKRLQIAGYMPGIDTSYAYNDTLVNGIKNAQISYGYKPDGILTTTLIKDLNVPVEKRVEQIIINMNRMRWMPQEPAGKLILVNIPEFVLHFLDGNSKVFDMPVVVGKEGNNTIMFTDQLSSVVFSPYWNVPPSIVKKEIMPGMARNANYLEQQNMEITGEAGGLPVVRQLPGEKNSLGKVKFLFPNSYNIYFHDTPAKSLFSRDKRAYSHGCIRLSNPLQMAQYLLKDNNAWPVEKIVAAMNSGTEKHVKLKDAIPVFITYYTTWVDETGRLNFRDDIYKHDSQVIQKMFVKK